jgi:hypothetical protein
VEAPTAHVPYTPQNFGGNLVNKQHLTLFSPILLAQTLVIMDLTIEGPSNNRSIGPINYDKWIGPEEIL